MPKSKATTLVDMNDVFTALRNIEDEHGIRVALSVFPVQAADLGARFGLAIKAYDSDGHLIRDLVSSTTYWPSERYTSWEAAALACIYTLEREVRETYIPLIAYLSRQS